MSMFSVLDCPPPTAPEFGSADFTSLAPGSQVDFSCNRGFEVTGPSSSLCLVTSEWEYPAPTCQRELLFPFFYAKQIVLLSVACEWKVSLKRHFVQF